jgi:hypothetical protein
MAGEGSLLKIAKTGLQKRKDRGARALPKRSVSRSEPGRTDVDVRMADVDASVPGLAGRIAGMGVPDNLVEEITQRVTSELQTALAARLEGLPSDEQRELIGLTRDGKRERDKALRAKFPEPDKDTWSPERSHKYCEGVAQHLLAYGMDLSGQESANFGFKCLPDSVQIHITPVNAEKHPLYGYATAFASWEAIVATIKDKYGERAQKNILRDLHGLRMVRGKVRQFKETFFELIKELGDGYCPSANDLLGIVQDAMYAELASQEAVKWSPSATGMPTAWKPAQYAELIDVCVNVDDLLAEAAKNGKSTFAIVREGDVNGSAGADKDVDKPTNQGKRNKRKGAPVVGTNGGATPKDNGSAARGGSGTVKAKRKRKVDFSKIYQPG